MKKIKITLLLLIILINTIFVTGCWNYREVDEMSIVAGLAVDKGIGNQYQITVEIVQISAGKETKKTSKTITTEGKTMFDAARNMITLSGKKLYWSHAKVIILSKEIASEGITKIIDWYNRDSETREDIHILISKGASAKEIFDAQGITQDIKSFTLDEIIKNQVSLGKAPKTDILQFDIQAQTKGISQVIPTVNLKKVDEKMTPQVIGTAIIKNDKLVGFLNGEETKDLIFIINEVKGGILVEETQANDETNFVSLEIFKSKTKITPIVDGKDIKINMSVDTTVAIGETTSTENFFDDNKQMKLEQSAGNTLKKRIESLVEKIQSEYDADIFGFGAKLQEDKLKAWKNVDDNWEEVFKDLKVNVKTKVHIKNSGLLSKPIKEGD